MSLLLELLHLRLYSLIRDAGALFNTIIDVVVYNRNGENQVNGINIVT